MLSDLRGSPVMLNFWAMRCPSCRAERPFIQEIHEDSKYSGLVILAVNLGDSPSTVEGFMKAGGYSFTVLLDTWGTVAPKYNIMYIPATFFIDKEGIIQASRVGPFSSKQQIEQSLGKIQAAD